VLGHEAQGVTIPLTYLVYLFKGLWDCFPLGMLSRRLTRYCGTIIGVCKWLGHSSISYVCDYLGHETDSPRKFSDLHFY